MKSYDLRVKIAGENHRKMGGTPLGPETKETNSSDQNWKLKLESKLRPQRPKDPENHRNQPNFTPEGLGIKYLDEIQNLFFFEIFELLWSRRRLFSGVFLNLGPF